VVLVISVNALSSFQYLDSAGSVTVKALTPKMCATYLKCCLLWKKCSNNIRGNQLAKVQLETNV